MASRLPVVIAQHAQRAGRESQFEEALVAELIFTNGLDATLIQGIDRILEGSTDHLCLEGLLGDYALVCWSTTEDLIANLNRLGVAGRLILHDQAKGERHSIALNESGTRKIYKIELDSAASSDSVMAQLLELLEIQNVRVVTLGSMLPKNGKGTNKVIPKVSNAPPKSNASDIEPATENSEGETPPPLSEPHHQVMHADPMGEPRRSDQGQSSSVESDDEWSHLDKLVDDLDAIM